MFKFKDFVSFFFPTMYFDSGDSGGGQPAQQQTQIADLPDWAKPYAQKTLEKASALTETPYKTYNAPRIAGFSPLQQQAQQQAAGMQTSGLTGLGGQVAGAAALGGLGQNYQGGQFSGGQFSPFAAGMYMSPFVQQALAPQLREAQRASDILGQQQAAQAVGRGAFGGSRDALMRAERERNLGIQQGDILSKGYQTAYEQAANQFNQDMTRRMQAQQLGEQSRQFGANLGLQGLNTALQGAGQLGSLGGQQFQQGMDINKLQSAYGGQQQALQQQGLDQAYQDFLSQQNYPYKQLGFMADMIRGMPLGQQTTSQMYQAPGSVAGQLAGLGMGAYGLSKLSNFMAEGGLAYADGGSVDAPDNVERIVSRLSDAQLQQAMKAAQARGDADQIQAIQSELAMRASERGGMAGAFNQLPQGTQNQMFTAANGGIVAFADGGGFFQDPMGAPSYERSEYSPFKQTIREGESYTPGLLGTLFGYNVAPAEKKTEAVPAAVASTAATRKDEPAAKPVAKPQVPAGSISSIAKKVSAATGAPEEDFMATYRRLRDEARAESKEDMKSLNEDVSKLAGRSKEIRDQGLARALAEFGFNMAAAAAKPGQAGNQGLRGLFQSAAAASPTLAASAARTDELARAADENAMKMRLTLKQYEIAQRKGDNQTASQMAAQMRMLQQTEKQLELKRAELAQQGGFQQASLGIQRADLDRKIESDKLRGITAQAQLASANARMADVQRKAGLDFDTANGRTLRKQLEEQYGPTKGEYMYNQRRRAYISEAMQGMQDRRAEANSGVQSVYDLLGRE